MLSFLTDPFCVGFLVGIAFRTENIEKIVAAYTKAFTIVGLCCRARALAGLAQFDEDLRHELNFVTENLQPPSPLWDSFDNTAVSAPEEKPFSAYENVEQSESDAESVEDAAGTDERDDVGTSDDQHPATGDQLQDMPIEPDSGGSPSTEHEGH